ncbi:hypothetical protein HDU97_004992 [Phlyctochytrium planicorne]|nr:hypothetical protein HDU97_004992 [Phlyctochytrium planicorne]
MAQAKIREGLELMASAEKAVNKTSWLGKKKPEWETARPLYDEAAVIFRNAKAYDHAVEAYVKSAQANKEEGSLFIAGKQLEQAGQIMGQFLNKPAEAGKLYQEASNYFQAHGSPDRAAEMLEKAAKQSEATDVNLAIELYREACGIYEQEDRLRTGAETFSRAVGMALKANKIPEAIEFSQRLTEAFQKINNRPSFLKQALSTVIIVLLLGDDVEASKRLEQYASLGFMDTEEGKIAGSILEAFQNYDEDLLADALKRPTIKYLETEVVRATQRLRVPGSGKKKVQEPPAGNATGGVYQQPVAPAYEEDDDDML